VDFLDLANHMSGHSIACQVYIICRKKLFSNKHNIMIHFSWHRADKRKTFWITHDGSRSPKSLIIEMEIQALKTLVVAWSYRLIERIYVLVVLWLRAFLVCQQVWGLLLIKQQNLIFKGPCIVVYSYNKPTRCTNFSNLFWNRSLHVSDSFSVNHQESSTVHTAIGVCHTGFADCLLAGTSWYR